MGHDAAIAIAGSMGNFELNTFKPVMIYNLLDSIHLLADAVQNFLDKCLKELRPNNKKIDENLNKSLMLATALNSQIGYEKAALVVKKAYAEEISLKQAALALGFVTEKQFDEIVNPGRMIKPHLGI